MLALIDPLLVPNEVGIPPQEHLSHGVPRFRLEAERPHWTLAVQGFKSSRVQGLRWISDWLARSRSSPAGAAGLGLAAAHALVAEGAHVVDLRAWRGGAQAGGGSTCRSRPHAGARVAMAAADVSTEAGVDARSSTRRSSEFGGIDVLVNNVGLAQGRRHRSDDRCRLAGGVRSDVVSGDPHVAARRAAHAPARRRRDRDRVVDLRPRIGRPDDLQRRQGRGDQPRPSRWRSSWRRIRFASSRSRRDRSCSKADRGGSGSRPIPKASRSSSSRSCRSGASASLRKSAPRSRFSRRRRPAGSAAPPSSSTAASRGCSRHGHARQRASVPLAEPQVVDRQSRQHDGERDRRPLRIRDQRVDHQVDRRGDEDRRHERIADHLVGPVQVRLRLAQRVDRARR